MKLNIILCCLSTVLTLCISLSVLVTWAYLGPCDWISHLRFDAPPVISYPYELPIPSANETFLPFAIVGDLQRTSFWECVIGREVNDAETTAIVKAIALSDARFLVALGDMIFDGGSKEHWQWFDKTILPIRYHSIVKKYFLSL